MSKDLWIVVICVGAAVLLAMIWEWTKRREQRMLVLGGPDYEAFRIDHLEKQVKLAREFSDFLEVAYKRGFKVQIIVEVDGQMAPSSIMIGEEKKEILRYLGKCSEAFRMEYLERLEMLRKGKD
jgi:hypothetical protein